MLERFKIVMQGFVIGFLVLFVGVLQVHAHGGGNWNAFRIDGVNDAAETEVRKIQLVMSEIIRGRLGNDEWPLPSFNETRDALITAKEEVDEVLEHFVEDGINIQLATEWHSNMRVGRTVAASQALGASIALVEHAGTLQDREQFVDEFYSGGLVVRLYELLDAHVDRMALYRLNTNDDEQ